MNKFIVLFFIIVIALTTIGLVSYAVGKLNSNNNFIESPIPTSLPETTPPLSEDEGIACTLDAKICPDGTGVGRVPPNCEFTPCPGE